MTERKDGLKIDGIIEIPNIGLYAKSPEALQELFEELRRRGYGIEDTSISKGEQENRPPRTEMEKKGSSLWYAKLNNNVLYRKGKCRSCGAYIDMLGIQSHKHKCEKCGVHTYLDFDWGSLIRFSFIPNKEDRCSFEANITMKICGFDEQEKLLLLSLDPIDGNGYFDYDIKGARKALKRNKDKWCKTLRNGVPYIAIRYNPRSIWMDSGEMINVHEISGRQFNYSTVNLYKGKEYGEYERLPIPESYSIWEVWHWSPLEPSPTLHEKIISAAGHVSSPSYYYQDGRTEYHEIHLRRMRLFVENFTTLDIKEWDRMIASASKSGPGMIEAVANFCSESPKIDRTPNMGNLLIGIAKIGNGEPLTRSEVAEMKNVMDDPKTGGDAADFLKNIICRK